MRDAVTFYNALDPRLPDAAGVPAAALAGAADASGRAPRCSSPGTRPTTRRRCRRCRRRAWPLPVLAPPRAEATGHPGSAGRDGRPNAAVASAASTRSRCVEALRAACRSNDFRGAIDEVQKLADDIGRDARLSRGGGREPARRELDALAAGPPRRDRARRDGPALRAARRARRGARRGMKLSLHARGFAPAARLVGVLGSQSIAAVGHRRGRATGTSTASDKRELSVDAARCEQARPRLEAARRERDSLQRIRRRLPHAARARPAATRAPPRSGRARERRCGRATSSSPLDYDIGAQRPLPLAAGRVFPARGRARQPREAAHPRAARRRRAGLRRGPRREPPGLLPARPLHHAPRRGPRRPRRCSAHVEADCAFEWITLKEKNADRPG